MKQLHDHTCFKPIYKQGHALLLSATICSGSKHHLQQDQKACSRLSWPSFAIAPCPVLFAQSWAWQNFPFNFLNAFGNGFSCLVNGATCLLHEVRKGLSKLQFTHNRVQLPLVRIQSGGTRNAWLGSLGPLLPLSHRTHWRLFARIFSSLSQHFLLHTLNGDQSIVLTSIRTLHQLNTALSMKSLCSISSHPETWQGFGFLSCFGHPTQLHFAKWSGVVWPSKLSVWAALFGCATAGGSPCGNNGTDNEGQSITWAKAKNMSCPIAFGCEMAVQHTTQMRFPPVVLSEQDPIFGHFFSADFSRQKGWRKLWRRMNLMHDQLSHAMNVCPIRTTIMEFTFSSSPWFWPPILLELFEIEHTRFDRHTKARVKHLRGRKF